MRGKEKPLENRGEKLLDKKTSPDRLLLALENASEAKRLDSKLYSALEDLGNGERRGSRQFSEVNDSLFKPGSLVKCSPEN